VQRLECLVVKHPSHLAALQTDIAEVQALPFQMPPQLLEAGEAACPAASVLSICRWVPEAAQLSASHGDSPLRERAVQCPLSISFCALQAVFLPDMLEVLLVIKEGVHC
jgi:hypothetical protein